MYDQMGNTKMKQALVFVMNAVKPAIVGTALYAFATSSAFAELDQNIEQSVRLATQSSTPKPVVSSNDTHNQIQVFDRLAAHLGLIKTDFERRDLLENREQRHYTLRTVPKASYYVVAVCDEDCGDVDLAISNDDGSLDYTMVDFGSDDTPVVSFTAKSSTQGLRVDLENCSTEVCFTHVALYQAPSGFSKSVKSKKGD